MSSSSKYINPALAKLTAGGGEMGEIIRSYNWATSPIGPVDSWPQSLKTSLSIILHSKFPMFLFWGKRLICFYNDAYRPSLGNDGKHPSALGMPGEEVWPEIWPDIKPMIDQVLSGGEATWSEDQLLPIYRNGQMEDVYWTFSYSPVIDETGKACAVFVTCSETTAKVQTLEALSESKDLFEFAIEATELGVWDFNPQTNKFTGNERLKEWFGLPPSSEIDLSDAIAVMAERDQERVQKAIQDSLVYGSSGRYDIEYSIINPLTGVERVVRAKGKAWFGPDETAYRFNGTLQDVTQQVASKKELETVAERLQLAIDAGNLGSYEFILSTGEIVATPQCKLQLGLNADDELSFSKLISLIPAEDRSMNESSVRNAILNNTTYHADYRIKANDGSTRWVRTSGNPVYNELGEAFKIVGITLDITEQKEFSDELSRQVAGQTTELQRSNEDLLQFAHVTSHDLKEPIRKIRIFANRIQEELGDDLPEKGIRYLEKIQNASSRVMSMIESVLEYSQLNASQPHVESIDLNKIILDVESDLEVLIQEKKAILYKDPLPSIEGYSVLIYQLFYNILNNALKFSKASVVPEIRITHQLIEQPVPGIVVTIEDNGIGFDNEYQSRIFTTFARLNSKDDYPGTGLGLALCKKIVERHHGSLSATGEVDRGAIFTITLPIRQQKSII
ncbi:ATP-binding protein [Dyadobacter sp. CY323]|uniref:PAS domain-containing sensor histidine kinase n=1 Tax=Dyadobacter sp. CY323 TaxID=2907302 RepID=UPI001F282E5D|nr:ATP-binding protein [Dyadobacter sp. CY323]MCE6991954.1 PAS domain-containing protein [Dyadobacter sp. CY323]